MSRDPIAPAAFAGHTPDDDELNRILDECGEAYLSVPVDHANGEAEFAERDRRRAAKLRAWLTARPLAALTARLAEVERERNEQAAILDRIDRYAPRADAACVKPGITLSQAARNMLREEGHPLFVGGPETP